MTEVWKSVPKKFCKICKCWFYDNKVSIQHHEQGSRHQFNVKNKLRELGQKGKEQQQVAFETRNALAKMEMEALRSYKKDLIEQPDIADNYNIHLNLAALPLKVRGKPNSGTAPGHSAAQQPHLKIAAGVSTIWREALCPTSGRSFYWNTQSGQSRWDPPPEGYLSLAEQAIENDFDQQQQQPSTSGDYSASAPLFGDLEIPLPSDQPPDDDKEDQHNSDEESLSNDNKKEVSASEDEQEEQVKESNVEKSDQSEEIVESAKKKIFPYGQWEVVEPTLTKPTKRSAAADSGEDKEEKEVKKLKFVEKKLPIASSTPQNSSASSIQFKKRTKFGGNLRSKEDD